MCNRSVAAALQIYLTDRAQGGLGMDDRRFDSFAKALAEGKSRRTVLKGLLGLGGAALAGSVILDGDSEAARRPSNGGRSRRRRPPRGRLARNRAPAS